MAASEFRTKPASPDPLYPKKGAPELSLPRALRVRHKPGQTEGASLFRARHPPNVTIPGSNPARIGSETTQSYFPHSLSPATLEADHIRSSCRNALKSLSLTPIQSCGLYDQAYAPLQMNTDGCMWGGDSHRRPPGTRSGRSMMRKVPHLKSAWRSPKGAEIRRYQDFSVWWAVNRRAKSFAPKHSEHPAAAQRRFE